MALPGKNSFPRASTEPTTSPAAQSAAKASGWRVGLNGTDELAGESTNGKPMPRGMEANTGDGRASRQPTFSHQDTSTGDLGKDVTALDAASVRGSDQIDGYGTQDPGCAHSQGGMGGVRDGGMAGPAAENFDS